MTDLVLTLIGPDRPGLVEAVAQAVAEHGGNWLESRMIHLGGQFAGILRVEAPPEHAPALSRALEGLAARGLRVVAESVQRAGGAEDKSAGNERVMRPRAHRPRSPGAGARDLAAPGPASGERRGAITDRTSAPMSGEMLFRADARVKVPAGLDAEQLRERLERLASDLTVEIKLE